MGKFIQWSIAADPQQAKSRQHRLAHIVAHNSKNLR
jgi:hypothetical protein